MDEIVLGGRRFRVIDFERRTVINDHYLMKWLRFIGADKVFPADGEGTPEYLVRVQNCILESLKAPELLAGYLLPIENDELQWSPEIAKATAAHIARLQDREDREHVLTLCMEVTIGFFKQGLDWLKRSRESLDEAQKKTAENNAPAVTALH